MNTTIEEKTMHCSRCGRLILEKDALYRGYPAQSCQALIDHDWRNYAHCERCDWEDYSNTYGGM